MIGRPAVQAKATSTVRMGARLRLRVDLAVDLVLCGLFSAGLPFLARQFQPDLARTTLVTGVVGGGLCVVWGFFGRPGRYYRAGAMLTLVAMGCAFMCQAVQSWDAAAAVGSKGRMAACLMAILSALCVSTLANLARAGREPR